MSAQNDNLEPGIPDDLPMLKRLANGQHPSVDVLRASSEGVLPQKLEALVRAHVDNCALCSTLQRDLLSLSPAGPTAAQQQRIHGSLPSARPQRSHTWKFVVLGTCALVVMGVLLLRNPLRESVATAHNAPSFEVAVSKAPITIPASMLPARGSNPADMPDFERWTSALKPYKDNDFAAAEKAIAPIAKQYHLFADAYLYLGVSQLLQGKNKDARGSLARANELSKADGRLAAGWYLGVAEARLGDLAEASRQWTAVCEAKGAYSAEACQADLRLKSKIVR